MCLCQDMESRRHDQISYHQELSASPRTQCLGSTADSYPRCKIRHTGDLSSPECEGIWHQEAWGVNRRFETRADITLLSPQETDLFLLSEHHLEKRIFDWFSVFTKLTRFVRSRCCSCCWLISSTAVLRVFTGLTNYLNTITWNKG